MLYEFDQYLLETLPDPTANEQSDRQLMARIKRKDDAALPILYRRYSQLLRGIAGSVLSNNHEVDDVLQDVFLTVWHQAEHYDGKKGKPLGWIITLTRRRAIDRARKAQAYSRARERFQAEIYNESDPLSKGNRMVEGDVIASDMSEVLDKAMAVLPPVQREAIHSAFYRGLSQREIAIETGTPLGTIKTRVQLGLRKLRGALLTLDGPTRGLFIKA